MIEMVGERKPGSKGPEALVRLIASQDRVCVEDDGTVAEMDAVIQEDGQCSVSRERLLRTLKQHREPVELTIEADQHGLRLAGTCLPVNSYCPSAVAPAAFQIFFANDLGLVSRGTTGPHCHGI